MKKGILHKEYLFNEKLNRKQIYLFKLPITSCT